jgi:hypothetical protein
LEAYLSSRTRRPARSCAYVQAQWAAGLRESMGRWLRLAPARLPTGLCADPSSNSRLQTALFGDRHHINLYASCSANRHPEGLKTCIPMSRQPETYSQAWNDTMFGAQQLASSLVHISRLSFPPLWSHSGLLLFFHALFQCQSPPVVFRYGLTKGWRAPVDVST